MTNGAGKIEFNFRIPEHRFAGQENELKFRTGEIEFRLTSDQENRRSSIVPASAGHTTYQAVGILETTQDTILATRNATVVQKEVSEEQSFTEYNTYTEIIQNVINNNVSSGYTQDDTPDAPTEQELEQIFWAKVSNPADPQSYFGGKAKTPENIANCFAIGSDPLAQTFLCSDAGGVFLTKIDFTN